MGAMGDGARVVEEGVVDGDLETGCDGFARVFPIGVDEKTLKSIVLMMTQGGDTEFADMFDRALVIYGFLVDLLRRKPSNIIARTLGVDDISIIMERIVKALKIYQVLKGARDEESLSRVFVSDEGIKNVREIEIDL